MNSNSANDASIESALDDTNKSSSNMINHNITNAPTTESSLKEGVGTTEAPEPNRAKIAQKSDSGQSVAVQPSPSVTNAHDDTTKEVDTATMVLSPPPTTTTIDGDEHGLVVEPPPNKRQKTTEEIAAPVAVVSSTNASITTTTTTTTAAAEPKTATPTVPSNVSTGAKPVVNNTSSHTSLLSSLSTTQLLLPDYAAVRQTVQDLLALLQLYGPLTANQLEYNLPPVVAATGSIPWSVHDVLTILVAIGLVQHVKGTTDQYCMFGGIPRATAIYPTEIMSEIQRAIQEAEESYQRCQILREALRCPTNTETPTIGSSHQQTPKNYLDVLKQLRHEYPQITNDPVYWTALRNCPQDHHHQMGSGTNVTVERRGHTANSKTKGSSKEGGGGGRSTKANKGATTTEATGPSIITTEKKVTSSKVPPTNSKSTESEATQRHATSIERESSQVSVKMETTVDALKAEPLATEKTDTGATMTNDGLLPKSAIPTLNEDTIGASTTTTATAPTATTTTTTTTTE